MSKIKEEIIARLKELRPYHISPYNLGDEGEVGKLIDQLPAQSPSQSPSPAAWVKDGGTPNKAGEYFAKLRHENDLPGEELTKDTVDYLPGFGWELHKTWKVIEWLDESPEAEGEAVAGFAFVEWCGQMERERKIGWIKETRKWRNYIEQEKTGEQTFSTTQDLYNLFIKENK